MFARVSGVIRSSFPIRPWTRLIMKATSQSPSSPNRKILVSHILIKVREGRVVGGITMHHCTCGTQLPLRLFQDAARAPSVFDEVEKQLAAGSASFAELVERHSECGVTRGERGGTLGWLQVPVWKT